MADFREEFDAVVAERFGSVRQLALSLDIKPKSIYSARDAQFLSMKFKTVMRICNALEIDPISLFNGDIVDTRDLAPSAVDVPLRGRISAGDKCEMFEDCGFAPVPSIIWKHHPDAYYLEVSGESMNLVFPSRSNVLVEPCTEFENGGIYAVGVGADRATLKRVRVLGNGIMLIPESTDETYHKELFDYTRESTPHVRPIGRVVWYTPPANWRA